MLHARGRLIGARVLAILLAAGIAVVPVATVAGGDPSASISPSPVPSPIVTPSVRPAPSLVPVEPAQVELLDAGRQPRRERRYAYQPGQREVLRVSMVQILTTRVGEEEVTLQLPPVEYTVDVTVVEVDDQGIATIDTLVTDIEALPDPEAPEFDEQTLAQANAELAQLIGMRVVTQVDPRGITVAIGLDVAQLDPAIAQQAEGFTRVVNELAAPFPRQAIGRGARWVTRGQATVGVLSFTTEQTSTLRRVRGATLELELDTVQTGVPGPVDLPSVPAGFEVMLESLDGSIQSQMTIDLGRLVPRSTATGSLSAVMQATNGIQDLRIETETHLFQEVAPAAD